MFEGLERIICQPGEKIFQEGAEGDCAYLIESGRVEISVLRENRNINVSILGAGDLFGEMALIDSGVRTATATAIEETCVVSIYRSLIEKKLTKTDPTIKHLLHLVLKRFRNIHDSLTQNGLQTPEKEDKDLDNIPSETQQLFIQHIRTASDIREALNRDEFRLYYQPIIAIDDDRLAGFEALIRWRHPEHGLIPPVEFLSVMENTGQILPVGVWIVERACHDFNKFSKEHYKLFGSSAPLFLSINLSANQLADAEHMMQLANIVHRTGVDPACIKWEVTETVLIGELEQAQQILTTLRDQGFCASLDDFGTGFSSLSYLQKFPVDSIKIDRSFINRMLSDHNSMQIVKASIGLAKTLDLVVVAEGVESKEEVEQLIDMGCSYCQGYYYAKPLPPAETMGYIRQSLNIKK